MRDLPAVLAALDPAAPLAERHIWLAGLFQWIRGRESSAQAAVGRVQLLIDAVESRPEVQARLKLWWRAFIENADLTTLLADFGFAPRTAFMSEVAERLRRKLLPGTPETNNSAELFPLVLTGTFDAHWLSALNEAQLSRISALLWTDPQELAAYWQHAA
jgi:site-specific recombinase